MFQCWKLSQRCSILLASNLILLSGIVSPLPLPPLLPLLSVLSFSLIISSQTISQEISKNIPSSRRSPKDRSHDGELRSTLLFTKLRIWHFCKLRFLFPIHSIFFKPLTFLFYFLNKDACYVLAFAVILLHTDAHSVNIKKKMTKQVYFLPIYLFHSLNTWSFVWN